MFVVAGKAIYVAVLQRLSAIPSWTNGYERRDSATDIVDRLRPSMALTTPAQIDPQLLPVLNMLPTLQFSAETLPDIRADLAAMVNSAELPVKPAKELIEVPVEHSKYYGSIRHPA